mmetsp:Transcript_36476/g.86620  ORF Transcript_36476/g.86620 Transcript_36476/m.86620 type:complete len:245 (-) Transcript_36476:1114-1848(-)
MAANPLSSTVICLVVPPKSPSAISIIFPRRLCRSLTRSSENSMVGSLPTRKRTLTTRFSASISRKAPGTAQRCRRKLGANRSRGSSSGAGESLPSSRTSSACKAKLSRGLPSLSVPYPPAGSPAPPLRPGSVLRDFPSRPPAPDVLRRAPCKDARFAGARSSPMLASRSITLAWFRGRSAAGPGACELWRGCRRKAADDGQPGMSPPARCLLSAHTALGSSLRDRCRWCTVTDTSSTQKPSPRG